MKLFKRLLENKLSLAGSILIGLFLILAVFAPVLATIDPALQDLGNIMQAPRGTNIMGTDELGRDIFSRIIWGARTSLFIGISVVIIGGSIGIFIGVITGYFGGKTDLILMRIMDTLMAFPTILLALLFVTIIGTGLRGAVIAVSLATIPRFARVVRGAVLSVRNNEYIEAAYVLGQSNFKILLKHVLPNCMAPIIVQITLTIGNSILTISGLGFLGLGAKPGDAEWGVMLSNARTYLRSAPHVAIFPGLAIAATVLGFNLLGDGLRDILDVRDNK